MSASHVKSSCQNCVFAFTKGHGPVDGETQTGCRLGRIEKFRERGTSVELKYDKWGSGFFIINRFCSANRNREWAAGLSEEQQERKVREEVALAAHVYVPVWSPTMDEIKTTLDSLTHQKPKPAAVEILVKGDKRPGKLILWLQHAYPDLNWKVTVLTDEEATPDAAIDSAVPRCESMFYAVFNSGVAAPADFLQELDRLVNDELYAFALIPGDTEGNGRVVLKDMHLQLGGNEVCDMVEASPQMTEEQLVNEPPLVSVEGIENKIRFLAEQLGAPQLIHEEALCHG